MPSHYQIGEAVTTVSDKFTALGQQGLAAVSGFPGTLSGGTSSAAQAFNAFSDKASALLKQGNISPAALTGAALQVTNALQQSSIFKGVPRAGFVPTEKQPEESRKANGVNVFKFPRDLGDHYIEIKFEMFKKDSPLMKEIKTEPVIIQLPLSPTMTETYQANYKTEALNVFGGMTDQIIKKYEEASANSAGQSFGQLLNAAGNVLKSSGLGAAGALGATAAMAALPGVAGAVSKALGATVNPNMAVLFDNVGFRSHQFAFKLNPRSESESYLIKQIIQAMRQRMLPPIIGNGFGFGFPDKATIKMFPTMPYPILECVLESMSVNYAPNGPAFYKGSAGNPVSVDIQLQFKEIELFTRERVQSAVVNPNDLSNQERDL